MNEIDTDCANEASECCSPHDATPETSLPRERRRQRPWDDANLEHRLAENGSAGQGDANSLGSRIPRRWDRLLRLVGDTGLRKLMGAHVTVFGLGGVGSYAAEALARSAIGRLTLVDFDDVCVTNVNRQLQAFPGTVGQSKANLMAARIKAINPDAQVDPVQAFYDLENSTALLTPRPDFVIDAIDNVTAKLHLVTTCLKEKIPIVSVTGSGARLDPTQVRVADVSQTKHDPLARVLRKELTRRGFDASQTVGLPVVFSEEEIRQPETPDWDADGFRCICPHAADSPHACEKRRIIYGTAGFVTAAFGMAATSVAVRGITEN
jgi:tRNA A37 threonylcarbamoyladenosine dehydratase